VLYEKIFLLALGGQRQIWGEPVNPYDAIDECGTAMKVRITGLYVERVA
jgi:hypothetical protein